MNLKQNKPPDNSPENSEFLLRPLSKWSYSITLTLISLASFGFIFAFFSRIEEVIISRGDLESNLPVQEIYPPLGGYVSEVLVREGELVEVNQPLLKLEADLTIKTKMIVNNQIKNETERYEAQLNLIELQIETLKESKINQEVIIPNLKKLVSEGAISKLEYFERKEKYINTISQINQKKSEIISLKKESSKIINEYYKELGKISRTLKYQNLKSSIKGKVFDLKAVKPGILLRENDNEPIMKIVPIDSLIAKIFILNKDIGFIQEGQLAKIRIDSYPFTEFGEIDGVLENIADEVVFINGQNNIPYYPATVKLNKQFLERNNKKYPLLSGQTVQVNLISRDKRVISLFTDVINKSIDSLKSIRSKNN